MKRMISLGLILFIIGVFLPLSSSASGFLTGTPIGSAAIDYNTGKVSETVNTIKDAFDGNISTAFSAYDRSFAWVGYDLGEKCVIQRVYYAPYAGWGSRMLLGVFEGANNPDFSDAIPLFIIRRTPADNHLTTGTVRCSRGFRYVRYVGPADSRASVAELKFYGDKSEGDDHQLYQLTNLPTLVMHTTEGKGDITSKTVYRKGIISIISEDGTAIFTDSFRVRGRGNGSWTFPKKPYKIKLNHKSKLLGMPSKAKDWALVNNWSDKCLMRNILAFEMNRIFQKGEFTPEVRPVDVIFNGEFKGNFQLTEQVEVHKNRLEITEMTPEDNSLPELMGGYFIEVDGNASYEKSWFTSDKMRCPVTIKYPKDDKITATQAKYIKNYFDILERRAFSTTNLSEVVGFPAVLNTESYLKRFIISELSGNHDALHSVYMYKDRNDPQFRMGTVWDADLAFENAHQFYPTNEMADYITFTLNGAFRQELNKQIVNSLPDELRYHWSQARNYDNLNADYFDNYIDSLATLLDASQELNYIRWPILDKKVQFNPVALGTYLAEVDRVKEYIRGRIEWMDNKIGLIPLSVEGMASGVGFIDVSDEGLRVGGFSENSLLQAIGVDGRQVLSRRLTSGTQNIALPAGIYIIQVLQSGKAVCKKKVLLK